MLPFWPAWRGTLPNPPSHTKINNTHTRPWKPYFLFSGNPDQFAVSCREGRACDLTSRPEISEGICFLPHLSFCWIAQETVKGKKHIGKGFWLVHLKALAGLKGDVMASSTALMSHVCAILHCRPDVDELAEYVIYCAWALKPSP